MQSGWTAPSQAYPYCSLHVSPGFAGLWRSMSRLLRGVCARFMRSHSLLRSASTGMSKASNLVPGVPDEFKNNWHSDESTIEGVANKPSKEIVLSVEELKRATETCFEVSNNAQAPDFQAESDRKIVQHAPHHRGAHRIQTKITCDESEHSNHLNH